MNLPMPEGADAPQTTVPDSYTAEIMATSTIAPKKVPTSLKDRLVKATAAETAARERKHSLIRRLRNDFGMSLRELAELTDVSHTGISRICDDD